MYHSDFVTVTDTISFDSVFVDEGFVYEAVALVGLVLGPDGRAVAEDAEPLDDLLAAVAAVVEVLRAQAAPVVGVHGRGAVLLEVVLLLHAPHA